MTKRTAAKKATPAPTKKTITKAKATKVTKVTKATKATKLGLIKVKPTKAAVKPKQAKESKSEAKSLEVCLLLDTTSSMSSWIERSKNTLKEIIQKVKTDYASLTIRVCFIGYRDIKDVPRFEIFDFSEDLDAATNFIAKQRA